ncbi:MAG: acyl carrier protein [Paracoccaceae bacterium]|nr:acyl carrier protein [Paracoccaceae bacterium]
MSDAGLIWSADAGSGVSEAGQIRQAYAEAASLAAREIELCSLSTLEPSEPSLPTGRLYLSRAITSLSLTNGNWLVTHAAGPVTQLDAGLWAYLQTFADGRSIDSTECHIWAFLFSRLLLCQSAEQEQAAAAHRLRLDLEMLPNLRLVTRPDDQYRQIHRPFTVARIDRPSAARRIALIGPCIAQQFAECLVFHGYAAGYAIDIHSIVAPEDDLGPNPPDLIVISAGQFVPYVVQFAARGAWTDAEALMARVVETIEGWLQQVRSKSPAPIAVVAAHPPALGIHAPGSADAFRLRDLFCRINLAVCEALETVPPAVLIDEIDARERLGIPRYWDDMINASAHRAPMSSWSWVPHRPDAASPPERPPPPGAGQPDPALGVTMEILRILRRLDAPGVHAIVFEPRGLLWPLDADDRGLARASMTNFLADVQDFRFAGISEALGTLWRRGHRLICLSDMDKADLQKGMPETSARLDSLFSRDMIASTIVNRDKRDQISRIATAAGAQAVLWADITDVPDAEASNVVRLGRHELWRMREIILRAPELEPKLPRPREDGPRNLTSKGENPGADPASYGKQQLAQVINTVISKEAGQAPPDDLEHIADLGIDSLGLAQVIAAIEEALDVELESWERGSANLFEVTNLQALFQRALQRSQAQSSHDDASDCTGRR